MPTELVMLHAVETPSSALLEAFGRACPAGSAIEFRDGQVTVLLDELGHHVLTIFPSSPIEVAPADLASQLRLRHPLPADARHWRDVTIPLGDDAPRRSLAERLAHETHGSLHDLAQGGPHV